MTAVQDPQLTALRGENFPVALRLLPRRQRRHLWALYRYARYVDDLGDRAAGDRRALLAAVASDVEALYGAGEATDPVVAALAPTVAQCRLPTAPLLDLVRANQRDQDQHRYETFADLLGYCALSANPVGALVLHVFDCATPGRVALSDRICTGLQLLEHLQDVGEDYRDGRVYLPQEDLRRFGVSESRLGEKAAAPELRALIAFQTDRALAWLNSGAVLADTVRGWPRLAIGGYLAGGRAAAHRLRASGFDPLPGPPKPTPTDVARQWLAALVSEPG